MSNNQRSRRSAKDVVNSYASELLARSNDKDVHHKIHTLEVIALRMGWNDIFNRLRYRSHQAPTPAPINAWWVDKD